VLRGLQDYIAPVRCSKNVQIRASLTLRNVSLLLELRNEREIPLTRGKFVEIGEYGNVRSGEREDILGPSPSSESDRKGESSD